MGSVGGSAVATREHGQVIQAARPAYGEGAPTSTPVKLGASKVAEAPMGMSDSQQQTPRNRLARLLQRDEFRRVRPRRGEVYQATILSFGDRDILVDLGAKQDGIVPPNDRELVDDQDYVEALRVGDHIPVVVLGRWGNQGNNLVSLHRGLQQRDWLRAGDLQDSNRVIEAEVVGTNRGGVIVEFGRLQGFVPNSHLTSVRRGLRSERLQEAKQSLVGRKLSLIVLDVSQRRRRLVMSERAARRLQSQRLLAELTPGEVRSGVVQNLVDFGAFVDLGGIDGLVHVSELAHGHVDHPRDVLSVGDEIDVLVLDVDRKRERISLSCKRLLPDPWETVTAELRRGEEVQGTVTGVQTYGAFIDLGNGVEGLAHVSKMPAGAKSLAQLAPGQRVMVSVVNINHWDKQIGLSLERILPEEQEDTAGE